MSCGLIALCLLLGSLEPAPDSTSGTDFHSSLRITPLGAMYSSIGVPLSEPMESSTGTNLATEGNRDVDGEPEGSFLLTYGLPIGITVGSGLLIYTLFTVRGKK